MGKQSEKTQSRVWNDAEWHANTIDVIFVTRMYCPILEMALSLSLSFSLYLQLYLREKHNWFGVDDQLTQCTMHYLEQVSLDIICLW